ncbi:hypothetical protein [Deinococcus pimensis]|nr:hypothetical protein [Deinococcus pimensis]
MDDLSCHEEGLLYDGRAYELTATVTSDPYNPDVSVKIVTNLSHWIAGG